MNKPTFTFKELIELVESSVKSGDVAKEYNDFLSYFRELGISSYVLNLLIQQYKRKQSNAAQEPIYDGEFFKTSPTFLPEKVLEENEKLKNHNRHLEKRIVDTNGKIQKQEKEIETLKCQKKNYTQVIIFAILAVIGGSALVYFLCGLGSSNSKVSALQKQVEQKRDSITALTNINSSILSQSERYRKELNDIKSIGDTYPLIITGLDVGNVYENGTIETDFGKSIYSSNTMFLVPRIHYYGLKSSSIKLYVKLFFANVLRTGDSSPSGYSYTGNVHISQGNDTEDLQGWGNKNKGYWKSGSYRFEIWYNGKILFSKSFTIY